jgi:DHA1 family tetracycline resistance protein-like MFS transporter
MHGLIVLKESLPPSRRRRFELWRANPLGAVVALKRFPTPIGLCGVLILMRLAHDADPVVWTYFTMLKFNWSPADVGYSLMAVWSLIGLVMPSLNAIMSRQVGPHEQGELQGALASLGSLTSIAAPPPLSNLFGYFTSTAAPVYFPGAAFFAAGVFLLMAAMIFARVRPAAPVESPAE